MVTYKTKSRKNSNNKNRGQKRMQRPRVIRRSRGRTNLVNVVRSKGPGELRRRFKVDVGVLTKNGLKIDVGPHANTSNSNYSITATMYQYYRVTRVTLHYVSLLNALQASGETCMWVNPDSSAAIPDKTDEISTVCSNSKGCKFASGTKNLVRSFGIPLRNSVLFSTGSGDGSAKDGSAYESQASVFIAVLDAIADVTNYARIDMTVDVIFSGPGTAAPTNTSSSEPIPAAIPDTIASDTWGVVKSVNNGKSIICDTYTSGLKNSDRFGVLHNDSKLIYIYPKEFPSDAVRPPLSDNPGTNYIFLLNDPPNIAPDGSLVKSRAYVWRPADGDKPGFWAEDVYNNVPRMVLVNKVVPSVTNEVNYNGSVEQLSQQLSEAVITNQFPQPIEVKITEDQVPLSVKIEEQPIKVNIDDQPVKVTIEDQPLLVNIDDTVDVKITDQPISVKEEKDFWDTATGIIGLLT